MLVLTLKCFVGLIIIACLLSWFLTSKLAIKWGIVAQEPNDDCKPGDWWPL